jgi:hypothetical protein
MTMTPEQISAEIGALVPLLREHDLYVNLLETLTSTEGAGAAIGVSVKTLERWRQAGTGPRFFMIGGRCRYPLRDLVEFRELQTDIDGHPQTRAADDSPTIGRGGTR